MTSGVFHRGTAKTGKETAIRRGGRRQATARWRDKRAQCAPRSVDWFCWVFSLFPQCVPSNRNVWAPINPLFQLRFSHFVELDHGPGR